MKQSPKSVRIKLDRIDKNIIRHLQDNGRIQNNDLAREIGLSPSSCLRRVKLLEEAGVIQNYTTVVDPQKIGLQLILFSRIWLVGQDAETIDTFIEAMKELLKSWNATLF
jgi:DNA-binding Lrp family transcriptional regulator